MERYLKATAATTSVTFQEDGVTVDPGTVTLTLTREDGTVIASAQATSGTGAAARTFNLTAATHLASLDVLRLDWYSATKGTLTTYAEVVGGFLFSVAELRALLPNTDTYPTADLITGRTLAEQALEDACGVPFVPRYFRVKVDGSGHEDLLLPPRPLSITSVTTGATSSSDGTALTAAELEDLRLYDDGRLYHSAGWIAGRGNVEIKGTHGYPRPPARVSRAALKLAERFLRDTPLSEMMTSYSGPDGTTQHMGSEGTRQRIALKIFDVPEAETVLNLYGLNHGIG